MLARMISHPKMTTFVQGFSILTGLIKKVSKTVQILSCSDLAENNSLELQALTNDLGEISIQAHHVK